jgi:tripeptide aminopeptidase
MKESFSDILKQLPRYQEDISNNREILLANLVMLSEIPAPTFKEEKRVEFIINRLNEYQLLNTSTDEVGNALGILPGKSGKRNILIVAHMDTVFGVSEDHTVNVQTDKIVGPGVGDNALGLATVISLPIILEQLGIELDANLILMGSSRSLGRGDIEGLRFFLANTHLPICAGICIEGVQLGRLSYSSIGMIRGEISYNVPEEYDWTRFSAGGAIVNINEVINRILEIPLPNRPRTTIAFRSIEGGGSFNKIPTTSVLKFEIRSESSNLVHDVRGQVEDIAAELSSQTGAEVKFNMYAGREPGGIKFSHPIAVHSREILKELKLHPRLTPSTSELSAFIDKGIPAVTIGLTGGENLNTLNETIELDKIPTGIAQLLGLIIATDRGYCNED